MAGRWQIVERDRGKERARQSASNGAVIASPLTDAERAWRDHQPCQATVRIGKELVLSGADYQAIASRAGCYLHLISSYTFGIWADTPEKAYTTKQALIEWSNSISGSSRGFTKLKSMTEAKLAKEEKKWQQEVDRYRFRQKPPTGSTFQAIGTFRWDSQDQPQGILGRSLEALDSIRTDHSTYIVLGNGQKDTINVLGNVVDVQKAMLRIRMAYCQIRARQQSTARSYHVHWHTGLPNSIVMDTTTKTYKVKEWNLNTPSSIPGKSIDLLESMLAATISQLHYYSGIISFRVRLGIFKPTSYLPPDEGCHTLEGFLQMIKQSQFAGDTKDIINLQSIAVQDLNKTSKLQPYDLMAVSRGRILPLYSARFIFERPDADHELNISWQETDNGNGRYTFTSLGSRWTKFDACTGPHQLLSCNLLKLDSSRGLAWHFDIHAAQQVNHPSDDLKAFASRVTFIEGMKKKESVSPFVSFDGTRGLRSLETRVVYRYRLSGTDYLVEVCYVRAWKPNRQAESQPRWTLETYHLNWDTMLFENSKLSIGKKAKWNDEVSNWFPADESGAGLPSFVEKMQFIEECL